MSQLIDKDALMAEIKKLEKMYCYDNKTNSGLVAISVFENINNVIDTLEVKEVDFEEYYHKFLQKERFGNSHVRTVSEMMAFTAKHFFELGLKAQKGEEV